MARLLIRVSTKRAAGAPGESESSPLVQNEGVKGVEIDRRGLALQSPERVQIGILQKDGLGWLYYALGPMKI